MGITGNKVETIYKCNDKLRRGVLRPRQVFSTATH